MSRIRKAWSVCILQQPTEGSEIVFAPTAGKARYRAYRLAFVCNPEIRLIDMRARRAPGKDIKLPARHEITERMSEQALACLLHACGTNKPQCDNMSSRKHFYTEATDWRMVELENLGLMVNTKRGWEEGCVYFSATELGLSVAKSCEPLYGYGEVA